MKAIVERTDLPQATRLRYVEMPEIFTGEDEAAYGPIALSSRSNAHVFASFAEAGGWVDNWGAPHGAFLVRPAVDR